jgi:hypothetical protein
LSWTTALENTIIHEGRGAKRWLSFFLVLGHYVSLLISSNTFWKILTALFTHSQKGETAPPFSFKFTWSTQMRDHRCWREQRYEILKDRTVLRREFRVLRLNKISEDISR